jgi:hypothetical protein
MKKRPLPILIPLLSAFLCILFLQCQKDPPAVNLPDDVALGESVIYLNGEIADGYEPDFRRDTIYHLLSFPFVKTETNIVTVFGFDWLPIEKGNFQLHSERILYIKALALFSQVVNEDLAGYEYELTDADEGYFNIEYLDTIKMEVKGRFKVKFKRTSKNGNGDLGLPKNLQYEGVFYENYRLF